MRDTYCVFPMVQRETKLDTAQGGNTNSNGIHISCNGYYGYQALTHKVPERETSMESMDFEHGNTNIQFNNYIAPEDRLSVYQQGGYAGQERAINRKRRWNDDEPLMSDLKKRREFKPLSDFYSANRYINSRQPTHNVPDMPRCLMGHFI